MEEIIIITALTLENVSLYSFSPSYSKGRQRCLLYPVDNTVGFPNIQCIVISPLDIAIQCLNHQGQSIIYDSTSLKHLYGFVITSVKIYVES